MKPPKARRALPRRMKGTVMKHLILTTAFAALALLNPAIATAKTIAGCEVQPVEGSNYFVKVDPTCKFDTPVGTRTYAEGESPLNPDDGDPTTNNVVTVSDN
jgi:hypothetical protein